MKYLHEDLTYQLRGIFFEIYNKYGPGLPEKFYQKAIIKRLNKLSITNSTEKTINIEDEGEILARQRLDLVIEDKILIEVKATATMIPLFNKQILTYLKVSKLKLGLLVNFGSDKLYIKRYINEYGRYSEKKSAESAR